ncbi:MAG: glycosyltransferase family 4 protein [Candidatus Micrarchaeaceae archaeon]
MDICVLNPYFFPYHGGTEKVLLEVYKRLSKRHNISVITSAPEGQKERSVDYVEGIKVVRLPAKFIYFRALPLPFLVMNDLNSAIAEERAELYHINNRYQYAMGNIRAIRAINAKLALTIHNSLPSGIDAFTDFGGLAYDLLLGRRIMHESDIITGVSGYAIRSTVPKEDRHKSHVVYNGVDYKLFRPGKKDPGLGIADTNIPIILNNGRLVRQKGQAALIKAFAMLSSSHDAKLVIIGRGPLEGKLTALARRLGVNGRFKITMNISESALPSYYRSSSLFVLPSLYEPAGLALMEAMACATPSIASKTGGIPEIMGRCGAYINPNDINMIYSKMLFALENMRSAERLARCARKRVIARNNWDAIAKRYESLFSAAIKR